MEVMNDNFCESLEKRFSHFFSYISTHAAETVSGQKRLHITVRQGIYIHSKNRMLYRVDISMSDCSSSWKLFVES